MPGPFSSAINIAVDLAGVPDTRPGTWGNTASFASQAKFNAPAGSQTRVLRVYGDFIAWPKAGVAPAGTSAEVGFGLKTTAPDGSVWITYPGYAATPYDNSFVWLQNVVTPDNASVRMSFDVDTSVGGLLGSDNILLIQSFVALNTTGLTIHMEPTFVVVYQFEPEQTSAEL
jgi:hypothetical protein